MHCLLAGCAADISNALVASDFPIHRFLCLHLLNLDLGLQQRAATLRLLEALLVPKSDPKQPPMTTPIRATSSAEASALAPSQLTFSDQQPQATGREDDSQQSMSMEASQACRQKLLATLIHALPVVLISAVSSDTLVAEVSQGVRSQADGQPASAQSHAQTTDIAHVGTPQEAVQQDLEAAVLDGSAMHALLGLLCQAAGDSNSKGMGALLAFPDALATVMPDLLAMPQVMSLRVTKTLSPIVSLSDSILSSFGLAQALLWPCDNMRLGSEKPGSRLALAPGSLLSTMWTSADMSCLTEQDCIR